MLVTVMVATLLGATIPTVVMSEHVPAQPAFDTTEPRLGPLTANLGVENLAPFDLVEQIALKKAQGLWGQGALGEPLPCADDDGDIVAYMFPFAIGEEVFPTYKEILQGVKEGRRLAEEGLEAMSEAERLAIYQVVEQEIQDMAASGPDAVAPQQITTPEETGEMLAALAEKRAKRLGQEKSFGVGEYGTVVVSARYDRFPIPVCFDYLPHYYAMGDLALEKAQETLGSSNVVLTRIYFLGLGHGQWFEFASGGGTVLMRAQSLDIEPADDVLVYKGNKVVPDPIVQSAMDEEWQRLEAEAFAAGEWAASMHTVDYHLLIPNDVQWCRGCSPTSASMVLGYYDNYESGMSVAGMGRLIDNWQDLTKYSDGTGPIKNVPNILEELRIDMGTTVGGSTPAENIGPGMMSVTNVRNGYSFSTSYTWGDEDNDWAWGKIKSEINANRPFVWSTGYDDHGHSLCAWGWTDDKYVICYDTWDPVGASLWYYNKFNNGPTLDRGSVITAVPGGGDGVENLVILQPDGGETLGSCETYPIEWHQSGTQIVEVDLWYSTDGGSAWKLFAGYLPASEGYGTYDWSVPSEPGTRVRVMVSGRSADGTWIANDGSYQNFTITDRCDLTIDVAGTGTTSPPPGTHTYDCCSNVTVEAIENDPCWGFSHWSGAASGTSPTATIRMNGDQSVTAHFTKKKVDLTIDVIGTGTTSPSPGTHTYDCGTDVPVDAIETDPCWEFSHWSGAASGTSPTATIRMDGDQSVTAHFTKKRFDLSIYVIGTGTTSPSPGTHTYDCCTQVTITAIKSDPCWVFSHWGATAGFAIDQKQEGTNYGFMFDDDVILWQEFKPTLTSLTRIHLYIAKNGNPGNLHTAVKDGDGNVLWETTVAQFDVVYGWNSIQVHPAVSLVPESSYYIYVWSDRDSPTPDNRYGWLGQTDSGYRRGISSVEKLMPRFDFAFATEGWRTDNPISIHMDDDKSVTAQFSESACIDADFSAEPREVIVSQDVVFTDKTTGDFPPYAYEWDFGDGNTSDVKDPTHHYDSHGIYTLSLKVTDQMGNEDTETKHNYIAVYVPGDADGDGDVDVFDLVKVKRIILGLDPPTCGADANLDGAIDVFDLVKIKRIILGLD